MNTETPRFSLSLICIRSLRLSASSVLHLRPPVKQIQENFHELIEKLHCVSECIYKDKICCRQLEDLLQYMNYY